MKSRKYFKRKEGCWKNHYIKARDCKKAVYGYAFYKTYSEVKEKKSEAMGRLEPGKKRVKKLT